jgi:hypothetical protein
VIDVKNARRSFSCKNGYSEHTVKRFKSDRLNRDVVISGFLSPYLVDDEFSPSEHVVWLGEMTLGALDDLRRDFETDYLQIDLSRDRLTFIPPWLFEYPPECYAERDSSLETVRSHEFVLPKSECPLGLLVLADRAALKRPWDTLSEEAMALAGRLTTSAAPARPILYLHVLDRFCQSARKGVPFRADALRQILFSPSSRILCHLSDKATPLASFDPLEVVKTLLDVLEQVAATCAQFASTFTCFKLAGPGILKGRQNDGNWQTLFAYCGGWRRLQNGASVKCGQSPLYLGQHVPCDVCNRLICHECRYCAQSCQACAPRQAGSQPLQSM